jgi:hypothetical protein
MLLFYLKSINIKSVFLYSRNQRYLFVNYPNYKILLAYD